MTSSISMNEVKELVNFTIDQNLKLQEKGEKPIAIGIEAPAGIGKTSILEQIAKERNMGFTKICVQEMDEAGDLLGFPMKEYECQVARIKKNADGTTVAQIVGTSWLNEKQLENPQKGFAYRQTGKTRMNYAKPAWVPEYNENGTMVVLDDYVRATPQLLQACMTLMLEQKYTSWSLPAKTTICLTNNPDDNNSNVNSLDEAQRTRFMNFSVEWSEDAWSRWAESVKIDGRCINFVMSYSNELFKADSMGNRICNPRSFTMFARMIEGIDNWDTPSSLSFITTIAKGCFKDEDGRFASMFQSFLRNKMHLLIQPRTVLLDPWNEVKDKLEKTVYDEDGTYRPDIASMIERRFTNFVISWLNGKESSPIKSVQSRILAFIENETKGGKRLFTKDMLHHMVKNITSSNRSQTAKLLSDPLIMQQLA